MKGLLDKERNVTEFFLGQQCFYQKSNTGFYQFCEKELVKYHYTLSGETLSGESDEFFDR